MPWLTKDTYDGEYASKFVCDRHATAILESDQPDDREGPWEMDEGVLNSPPPGYVRQMLLWCEVDGCNRVLDPSDTYREATVEEWEAVETEYAGLRLLGVETNRFSSEGENRSAEPR
jgi:hypothetical protein